MSSSIRARCSGVAATAPALKGCCAAGMNGEAVERQRLEGIAGGEEMAHVRRVEGPAEDAEPHAAYCLTGATGGVAGAGAAALGGGHVFSTS